MTLVNAHSLLFQINDARQRIFFKGNKQLENIPPTKGALEQHVKQCMLQANIWWHALDVNVSYLNPVEFGWRKIENSYLFEPV